MANVLEDITVSAGSQVFSTNKLRGKGKMHYEVRGTFAGTWQVRRALDGTNFVPFLTGTAVAAGTVDPDDGDVPAGALYDIGLSAYTSGTAVCTIRPG